MSEGTKCILLNVMLIMTVATFVLVFTHHWAFIFISYAFWKATSHIEDTIDMTGDVEGLH